MKHFSFYLAVLLLVAVSFAVMLDPVASRGQSKDGAKPGADAAKRNALLSTSLTWTFGSKPQQGWYIYTPLIERLINTKQDSASAQFARAVARWQTKSGLKPSGILDEETLYAMIKTWQDARLKDRTVAQPDQLFTAPCLIFMTQRAPKNFGKSSAGRTQLTSAWPPPPLPTVRSAWLIRAGSLRPARST